MVQQIFRGFFGSVPSRCSIAVFHRGVPSKIFQKHFRDKHVFLQSQQLQDVQVSQIA